MAHRFRNGPSSIVSTGSDQAYPPKEKQGREPRMEETFSKLKHSCLL